MYSKHFLHFPTKTNVILKRAIRLLFVFFAFQASLGPANQFVLSQSLALKRKTLTDDIRIPLNPELFGIKKWNPGEASSYKVTVFRPGYSEVFHLSFSILGKEDSTEKPLYWLETQTRPINSSKQSVVNKALRPFGSLRLFARGAVGNIVTQVGEGKPLAIPVSLLNPYLYSIVANDNEKSWRQTDSRMEEIQVAAGNFKTRKARFRDGDGNAVDIWFTDKVGPAGVVRASTKNFDIELLTYAAEGSVSAIIGTPVLVSSP